MIRYLKIIRVEVKINLRAIHAVGNALFQLAYAVSEYPEKEIALLLISPKISENRVHHGNAYKHN